MYEHNIIFLYIVFQLCCASFVSFNKELHYLLEKRIRIRIPKNPTKQRKVKHRSLVSLSELGQSFGHVIHNAVNLIMVTLFCVYGGLGNLTTDLCNWDLSGGQFSVFCYTQNQ